MALYLLLVIGIWGGLSVLLIKVWQRLRSREALSKRAVNGVCGAIAVIWFGGSAWIGGGRILYYDMQVDRMCRVDGGIVIFETVELPAHDYEMYARKNWSLPSKSRSNEEDLYVVERMTRIYRLEEPRVSRTQYQIIRRSDGKVLGTLTSYGRGGGDLPGPWHGTSYRCPRTGTVPALETSIFQKSVRQ